MCKEIKCPRCNGRGYISSYKHVEDGICFLCAGRGITTQEEYEKYIVNQQKSEEHRIKRLEKLEAYRKETAIKVDAQREEREKTKNQPASTKKSEEHLPESHDVDDALDTLFKYWDGE